MIREYWQARAPREKYILILGACAAALIVLWAYGFVPTQKARVRLGNEIISAQNDLKAMREAAGVLAAHKNNLPSIKLNRGGKGVLSLVDESVRSNGLSLGLKRLEPVGEGRVEAVFERVPFDDLMRWLENLQASDGVRVDALGVTRVVDGVGLVDARLSVMDPVTSN